MGLFERHLTVWVFLCIVVGVVIEVPVMLVVANSSTTRAPGVKPGSASRGTTNAARPRAFIRRRSDQRINQTYM